MIIILDDLCFSKYTRIVYFGPSIVKEMSPFGGGYVITDGGYPTCYGFMNPIVPSYDYHYVVWGEWVESVRKDVARLFGALKNRFVRLKSNILYHKVSTITAAVRVCSISQSFVRVRQHD